ncbi:hypothetical protein GCM10027610_091810 [Dactylosporangium cerinum]
MSGTNGQLVVAVDGPSGSGKSTISRRVAQAVDARYLDTGAMYRAVTWAVLRDNVDLTDAEKIHAVAANVTLTIGTDPAAPHISVDGVGVDREIRGAEVTQAVSAVSAVPGCGRGSSPSSARSSPRRRGSWSRAATSAPSSLPTPT